MSLSRADRSRLTDWWFTVDRVLMLAILILFATGLVLSLAASPAVALKKGLPAYHFVKRHLLFAGCGAALMLAVSFLTPVGVRRLALALFLGCVAGLIAVPLVGTEVNGAYRWLSIGGHSLQPSEFLKPGFAVLIGWMFAEAQRRPEMPALALAIFAVLVVAGLLVAQPDVGQTLLIAVVWGALFFVSGQPLIGAAIIGGLGVAGLSAAYAMLPHVKFRIDRFFSPLAGDNSQVDRAIQSFSQGGFLGRGPGEGTIKTSLPDAHTDFIFAVVAEEYGALLCLVLLVLFAFVVLRALRRARDEPDAANRFGIIALALMFGLQALINMGVNVGLLPAKGMTLPLISYGGSSTLAISITLGMLLALTRWRPGLGHAKKP